MAYTTVNDVKTSLTTAPITLALRYPSSASITGTFYSMWQGNQVPLAGTASVSGVAGDIPTNLTQGAIPIPNAVSGDNYLLDVSLLTMQNPGVLFLYDRLWHNSGLISTTTGSQTVNSVPLTRPDTNGVGAELWIDSVSAIGAGVPVITCSYTNSAGTSGRVATVQIMGANAVLGRCFPFTLDLGDVGVKSVQDFNMTISRTSGTQSLVLRRRIAVIPLYYVGYIAKSDIFTIPMAKLPADVCLEALYFNSTAGSTTPFAQGSISVGAA